jgi:hypothetical protein
MATDINHELSRKASGILNIIGCEELQDFFNEVYGLFEMYDTDEDLDAQFDESSDTPINHLRLIQTARIMSRLARKYERSFRKINKKFPQFDEDCIRTLKENSNEMQTAAK